MNETVAQENKTENPKNNNKLFIIIGIVVVAIAVIVVAILLLKKNPKPDEPKQPTMTDEEKQEYLDQLNSEEGLELSQVLYNYAIEIYNEKKYLELGVDKRGVYYATKFDLEALEYDTSLLDEKCNNGSPIIYFDVDNKLNESYEFEPITFNPFCEE